tara:strand:+ start:3474 stop:3935 length:462 start_codon:yes stop_codon:yes gene_type:complete
MIIVGPVGVSKKIDEINPNITEKTPINEEMTPIWIGDFETCLAAAAGIINIEVTSRMPTTFTHVATKIINKVKKMAHIILVFTFSAIAIFSSIVNRTSLPQIKYKTVTTNKVATKNQTTSLFVTVKISPNKYESKLTRLFNKLIETIPIDNDE